MSPRSARPRPRHALAIPLRAVLESDCAGSALSRRTSYVPAGSKVSPGKEASVTSLLRHLPARRQPHATQRDARDVIQVTKPPFI